MSKIGKKPISIPEKVNIDIQGTQITVKGPLGELKHQVKDFLQVDKKENLIFLSPVDKSNIDKKVKENWGLDRKAVCNLIEGVSKGFEKKLLIEGVGYKAQLQGKKIIMSLGYSHPVEIMIPDGVKVEITDNVNISVKGIDRYKVGQLSAMIRHQKLADPYQAKGVRYHNEVIKRKVGKTGV